MSWSDLLQSFVIPLHRMGIKTL